MTDMHVLKLTVALVVFAVVVFTPLAVAWISWVTRRQRRRATRGDV